MASLRIALLGPLRVERDGRILPARAWRSRQELRLLSAILVARGQAVPVARLVEWLWPGTDPEAGAVTLRSAVSSLRRTLEPGAAGRASGRYIETHPGGYSWARAAPAWVDLEEFLACADPPDHMPSEADLARAVALYRGDLLEDEPDLPWALSAREHARGRFLHALEVLAERRLARDEYASAAKLARRGLEFDALCEPLCRTLMLAEARTGDIAGALQGYERFRVALDHELGASPSAQTRALHSAILRGEHLPDRAAAGQRSPGQPGPADRMPRRGARLARTPTAPPLVGREAELAQLRGWVAALSRPEGGVVALFGEAGIGKTRLLAELAHAAEARGAQPIVMRCTPLERGMPLAALAEAIRPLARGAPDALLRRLPQAALAQLAELIPALRERAPGLPALPALPPDQLRSRLVESAIELALALARHTPLVICCDDAQWADDALLATIGRLGHLIAGRAILIVLAYRAEELAESPGLHALLRELGRAMLLRPLLLGPLSETDAAALAAGPGGEQLEHVSLLARRLAARGAGNPLMIGVAVQALLEAHGARTLAALPPELGRDGPLPDPAGAALIRDLVGARLDRLPQPARALLEQIAVLGRPASLDLIEQLGGVQALEHAQLLLDRKLLAELDDERLDFVHQIVRSTQLALLGAPRRRLVHRQLAQALVALHADAPQHAIEIAGHLLEAGRGFEAQLRRYAVLAGDYSAHTLGPQAAQRWYGVAAMIPEDGAGRPGPEAE